MQIDRLKRWPADLGSWLRTGWIGWLALITPLLVFLLLLLTFTCWEPRIRLTGMLLELAGLLTVALGLRETRKLFRRQGLFAYVRNYLAAVPLPWKARPNPVVVLAGSIMAGNATLSAHATVSPAPGTPIEDRVARLEKETERLSVESFQIRESIKDAGREQRQAIEAEAEQRKVGDQKTGKQLEEAVAGGLHLEMIGVCWIAWASYWRRLRARSLARRYSPHAFSRPEILKNRSGGKLIAQDKRLFE